jgi:hypothetical protein
VFIFTSSVSCDGASGRVLIFVIIVVAVVVVVAVAAGAVSISMVVAVVGNVWVVVGRAVYYGGCPGRWCYVICVFAAECKCFDGGKSGSEFAIFVFASVGVRASSTFSSSSKKGGNAVVAFGA